MASPKPGHKRWLLLGLALLLVWYWYRKRHATMPIAHETPQSFNFDEDYPNLSYRSTDGYAPGQTDVDALTHLAPETRAALNRLTYRDRVSGKYGPNSDYKLELWNAWQFFFSSGFEAEMSDAAAQIGDYWHSKGIGN